MSCLHPDVWYDELDALYRCKCCPAIRTNLGQWHIPKHVGAPTAPSLAPPPPPDLKYDADKLEWHLLRKYCTAGLEGIIRVLMFGAKKYKAGSWKSVQNAQVRYRNALDRHLAEIDKHGDDSRDVESGEKHWHHVATNAIFLAELAENPQ